MGFISNIRTAGTGVLVPAEVHPCGQQDVQLWQKSIHTPFIAPRGGIGSDWNWPANFIGCNLTEAAAGRQAITFQIRVASPNGDAVPVAQGILSLPYAYPGTPKGKKDSKGCVFVWFIAAAPEDALQKFGVNQKFAVMAPLLDTAIQVSLSNGLEGRIGLHAAPGSTPEESDELAARYTKQGLQRREAGRGRFRMFRREDGRLFYFDEAKAVAYAAKQDDLR